MEKEKTVKISFECWQKLSKLARILNKPRKTVLSEIISPLFNEAEGLRKANLKIHTTVLNGVVFSFEASDVYSIAVNERKTLEKIKRQKEVVKA